MSTAPINDMNVGIAPVVNAFKKTKKRENEPARKGPFSTRGWMYHDLHHLSIPSKERFLLTTTNNEENTLFHQYLKPSEPYRLPIVSLTLLDHIAINRNLFRKNELGEVDCPLPLNDMYEAITPEIERQTNKKGVLYRYETLSPDSRKEFHRTLKNAYNVLRNNLSASDKRLSEDDRALFLGCGFDFKKGLFIPHLHPLMAGILLEKLVIKHLAHDTGHFDEYHRVEYEIYKFFQHYVDGGPDDGSTIPNQDAFVLVMNTVLDHIVDIVGYEDLKNSKDLRHINRRIHTRIINALEYLAGRGCKKNQPPVRIEYSLFWGNQLVTRENAEKLPYNRFLELRIHYKLLRSDAPSRLSLNLNKKKRKEKLCDNYQKAVIETNRRLKQIEKGKQRKKTGATTYAQPPIA